MRQSPEEEGAVQRLEVAIRDLLKHRGHEDIGLFVESISIIAATSIDEDGDDITQIRFVTSGDGVPRYRLLGLLDFVANELRQDD